MFLCFFSSPTKSNPSVRLPNGFQLICPLLFFLFSSCFFCVEKMMKRETLIEAGIIGGLAGAQVIYAGNSELLSQLLSLGIDPLLIVILCTFASVLLITPLAFLLERYLLLSFNLQNLCFELYSTFFF